MGRINQAKVGNQFSRSQPLQSSFNTKIRLDLNELLKRRQEERKVDEKINLKILPGAMVIILVALAIINL